MADFIPLDQISAPHPAEAHDPGFIPLDQVTGPSRLRQFMREQPHTTLAGIEGAVTRGLAPYAAGAAVGAAAGAPLAGVGAIPGAAAGIGAVALTDLASLASRGAHAVLGTPVLPSASDVVGRGLDALGVRRPQTGAERVVEATAGGLGGGLGMAKGGEVLANALSDPALRAAAAKLAARPLTGAASGAGSGGGQQTAAEGGIGAEGQFLASLLGGVLGGGLVEGPAAFAASRTPAALQSKAADTVLARLSQDARAGGVTAQDILDLRAKTPAKPLTLADLGGENTLALAGKMARSPGEARQTMTNFLNTRDQGAGTRLAGDVDAALGKGSGYDTARELAQVRSVAARPLYEEAFAQPVTMADVRPFQRFVTDKIGQDALAKGMRVVELEHLAEGKMFDPEKYGVTRSEQTGKWIIDPDILDGKKAPSMRMLDAVKRGYDDIVEGFRDPTSGRLNLDQYGRAVNDVRANYTGALRTKFPKYNAALDAWAGPSRSLDALRKGQSFSLQRPEEIARQYGDLSAGDREFFKLGVADKLRTELAKKGPGADEAKAIIGSDWKRSQLRPLFNTAEDYDRFIHSVEAEARMFATRYEVLGNSKTAARAAEDQSPDMDPYARFLRAGAHAAHGNHLSAVMNLMSGAKNLLSRPDPRLHGVIANLLTDTLQGPDSNALRLLQGFGNGAPSRPPIAGPIAAPAIVRGLTPALPPAAQPIPGVQQQQQ